MRALTPALLLATCLAIALPSPAQETAPANGAAAEAPAPTDPAPAPAQAAEQAVEAQPVEAAVEGEPAQPAEAAAAAQPVEAAQPAQAADGAPQVMRLSLADAIRRGMENNLDVAIVRHGPAIADYDHRMAWARHEPVLSSGFTYASTETPASSPLQGGAGNFQLDRTQDGNAGLAGVVPVLGWRYNLRYTGRSLQSTQPFQDYQPQYTTNLNFEGTLPLLRGFLWGDEWVQVRSTGIGQGIAFEQFRQQLMDTVRAIETAYWNLAARAKDLAVAQKSLETARALLERSEAQYEVGLVSRVAVVEAEAGMADREFRLIRAGNNHEGAQDRLINLVLGARLRPGARLQVIAEDDPSQVRNLQADEKAAAAKAFELRPELAISRNRIAQQALLLRSARNQRLPQLDVVGSYGFQGLGGAEIPCDPNSFFDQMTGGCPDPPPPPAFPRDYSDTHDNFFSAAGAGRWSGGVVFSLPLGNSAARARQHKRRAELLQARARAARLSQSIVLEVRGAVRGLRSALEGIEAADRRVAAAREQLRAEQVRLELGESTPFAVLEREEVLVDAERQHTGALQTYHDSVSALDRAQGTILRDRGVVVEEALPLR
ncbi:MAG: TolC family protein [Deltaproteobacteria bacterium]|nr:TolC family protein [Deltaproteobacteria bacterium]